MTTTIIELVTANVTAMSLTSISGNATRGAMVVLGGSTIRVAPQGISIHIMVWMK